MKSLRLPGQIGRLRRRAFETPLGFPLHRPNVSWAQFGEDLLIQRYLGEGPGHYVDVGAGHPISGSNTYQLYRLGWTGVAIEPIRALARIFRKRRPRDQVLNVTCGNERGLSTFFEFDPWQLSTADPARAQELRREGTPLAATYQVSVIVLRDLGLIAQPGGPTVLTIDAEGMDLAVLQGNDWATYLPSLICVEEAVSDCRLPTPVGNYLREREYVLVSRSVVSSLYLHERLCKS